MATATDAGKCSPDKQLMEWAYTREIADMVAMGLRRLGVDVDRIVRENIDVSLSERCRRANEIYKETGKKAILVSFIAMLPAVVLLGWEQRVGVFL